MEKTTDEAISEALSSMPQTIAGPIYITMTETWSDVRRSGEKVASSDRQLSTNCPARPFYGPEFGYPRVLSAHFDRLEFGNSKRTPSEPL